MTVLLRSAPERKVLRRLAMVWCYASMTCIHMGLIEEAGAAFLTGIVTMREVLKPSRSWQKGINRVPLWAFENMYSEAQCYQCACCTMRAPHTFQ